MYILLTHSEMSSASSSGTILVIRHSTKNNKVHTVTTDPTAAKII